MNHPSIDALHRNKVGKVSDKWESYLGYYDTLFSPLRDKPVSMLEIGVQNGGSLETWSSYFGAGKLFVGCDIDPKCGALQYDDPRVRIVVGDANAAPAFEAIRAISPDYDIVIDDGSHVSTDIVNAFLNYFPLVKPGGLFVVEDTHTLYNDAFGGGILNEFGAYAFFKRLVDVVNFQFWRDQVSINAYFRTFFPLRSTPAFLTDGWVDSIDFRNSVITIRKALAPGHEKLGPRVLVGTSAQVQTWQGSFVAPAQAVLAERVAETSESAA
jgi:SAM-dependent methyltransferase